MLPLLLLLACKDPGAADPAAAAAVISVHPDEVGQGTQVELDLSATASAFSFGDTLLDAGEGIDVRQVDVDDVFGARAFVDVAEDAALGPRDLVLTIEGREVVLEDAVTVIAESMSVAPERGRIGETVELSLLGRRTAWDEGSWFPSFGDEIEVLEFTVLGAEAAVALVSISPDAAPGRRDVRMVGPGGDTLLAADAFLVDRLSLAAEFSPAEVAQGDVVSIKVEARGTDFTAELPTLRFSDAFGESNDIVLDSVTVIDADTLVGQISVSNAALPGPRDVLVLTGTEGVTIVDATTVTTGPWSIEDVAIDLRFHVDRDIDNETGAVDESVTAYCMFYIPLDPSCPAPDTESLEELGSPGPYDRPESWSIPGSDDVADDCPWPRTFPAGDVVTLESASNTVTLQKVEDAGSGAVYYIARELSLSEYVVDEVYDLVTPGEPLGIGAYRLEGVQPTVPSDWALLAPDLWGNDRVNRAGELCLQWTPARTYPDAYFYTLLWTKSQPGPMVEDGMVGYVGAIPWDDGLHCFQAGELSTLAAGTVPVSMYSLAEGREFGLPGSQYQDNQARTWIRLQGTVVLE
ncbi:MAG: hypothetical protein H6742_12375 [Alphaproteobacteria bacterium]|nr:hypothetical protein [Alphaproteobacteria bacterium]